MEKLIKFVSPILRGVAKPVLVLGGSILGMGETAIESAAKFSDDNPKKTGVIALLLGWWGIDPAMMNTVGGWLINIGGWIQVI